MERSRLKEILRPAVREALSDYLKDSEQDMRALQSAHPQLDLTDDLPSEPGAGDNGTRGVKTESQIEEGTCNHIKSPGKLAWKEDEHKPIFHCLKCGAIGKYDFATRKIVPIKKENVEEASTSDGAGGYQTPYAFSDNSLDKDVKKRKIAQQLGMKIVEMKSLKEEVRVNIMKAIPLTESFRPHLQTTVASVIYNKILDYLLMTDDPKLDKIKAFRKFIDKKVSAPQDKKQLIQVFNDEFRVSDHEAAWEYYK